MRFIDLAIVNVVFTVDQCRSDPSVSCLAQRHYVLSLSIRPTGYIPLGPEQPQEILGT